MLSTYARYLPVLALLIASFDACAETELDTADEVGLAVSAELEAGAHADAAARICSVLHALPAQRKKECCNSSATNLAELCTKELTAALERKHASIDDTSIDACATATNASLQGCDWVGPLQPALPKTCATLINGNAEAGTQCHSSLECNDGLYCRGLSPLGPGTCAAPAQPGTRCEIPADNLASFTRATDDPRHPTCNGLCLRGQCLAAVPAGGQCHASAICATGLSCVEGQCQTATLPKLGETCSATPGCADGASCVDSICTMPKAGGESCKLPFECRSLECSIKPGQTSGMCADACAVIQTTASVLPLH